MVPLWTQIKNLWWGLAPNEEREVVEKRFPYLGIPGLMQVQSLQMCHFWPQKKSFEKTSIFGVFFTRCASGFDRTDLILVPILMINLPKIFFSNPNSLRRLEVYPLGVNLTESVLFYVIRGFEEIGPALRFMVSGGLTATRRCARASRQSNTLL